MALDVLSDLESERKFLEHRAAFPAEALARFAGRWIAWSADGARIVADSEAPEDLHDRIRAAGADPEGCMVEGIPATDAVLGGAGLGLMESRGVRGFEVSRDKIVVMVRSLWSLVGDAPMVSAPR